MRRIAKTGGSFLLTLVIVDIVMALLNAGPTQPPEWWTLFMGFGEVWGLAWLGHQLVHGLWENVLGDILLTVVMLVLAFQSARGTWLKNQPKVLT